MLNVGGGVHITFVRMTIHLENMSLKFLEECEVWACLNVLSKPLWMSPKLHHIPNIVHYFGPRAL